MCIIIERQLDPEESPVHHDNGNILNEIIDTKKQVIGGIVFRPFETFVEIVFLAILGK